MCKCKGKCCCKSSRGPIGPTGPKGKDGTNGATGPQGPAGALNMQYITQDQEQVISAGDGITVLTDMTTPINNGVYAVWFDGTAHAISNDTQATYGIYLDGVLQLYDRLFGATGVGGVGTNHQSITCNVAEISVSSGFHTLTVDMTVTTGSVMVSRSSLFIQKIS